MPTRRRFLCAVPAAGLARAADAPPTNSWRYQTCRASAGKGVLFRGSYEIMPRAGDLLILALRWVPQFAWVSLDGKLVGGRV
ncbi:MAG: hypothetical protein ABSE21_02455 [Bryobacteraceae bacterium]|jgi:hypothetical protein